ncbi:MAG: glycosyltransferase family 39 protein [Verrucomicrobiota bacterium]
MPLSLPIPPALKRLLARPWFLPALLCLALAGMFLDHVLTGPKPWETKWAERVAAGKAPGFNDYIETGLWWAALANTILATALALTAPLWAHRCPIPHLPLTKSPPQPATRRFWIILTLILLVVALPLRLAGINQSMWGDEDRAFYELMHGEYEPANDPDDGALTFTPHPWKRTFFYDKWTNNQYFYTVTARLCIDTWRTLTGAAPQAFTEWPLRIPPLLGGLASILAGALLLRRIGLPNAALVFALLLALHPWHLRYSVEGRGYTLLVAFFLFAVLALINALESGRWRWWLTFGAMEFFTLYTWKAAVHPLLALNLVALAIIFITRKDFFARRLKSDAFAQTTRCLVANLLAAIPFIWLFAPAVPQIQRKLATSLSARGEMGLDWLANVWSQLTAAMDWSNPDPTTPFHTVQKLASAYPAFLWLMTLAVPLLILIGITRLAKTSPALTALLLSPLAGALIAWIHFTRTNNLLLQYYLFYTLPFLLAFIALALTWPQSRRWRIPSIAAGVALCLILFTPHLTFFLHHPMQEAREASAVLRTDDEGRFHLGTSEIVTAGLYRVATSDDPRNLDVRTPEALVALAQQCDADNKTLRVSVSNLVFATAAHQDYFELLEKTDIFKPLGTFYGWKHDYSVLVWEYIPGSLAENRKPTS